MRGPGRKPTVAGAPSSLVLLQALVELCVQMCLCLVAAAHADTAAVAVAAWVCCGSMCAMHIPVAVAFRLGWPAVSSLAPNTPSTLRVCLWRTASRHCTALTTRIARIMRGRLAMRCCVCRTQVLAVFLPVAVRGRHQDQDLGHTVSDLMPPGGEAGRAVAGCADSLAAAGSGCCLVVLCRRASARFSVCGTGQAGPMMHRPARIMHCIMHHPLPLVFFVVV